MHSPAFHGLLGLRRFGLRIRLRRGPGRSIELHLQIIQHSQYPQRLLAIRAGRAVTLRPSAEESFRSDCLYAIVYHVKTGVKADVTLVAQDIDLLFDKGAYAHGNGMNVPRRGSSLAWSPYRVPYLRVVGRSY